MLAQGWYGIMKIIRDHLLLSAGRHTESENSPRPPRPPRAASDWRVRALLFGRARAGAHLLLAAFRPVLDERLCRHFRAERSPLHGDENQDT